MQRLTDERAYEHRDHRQIFLFCNELKSAFESGGNAGEGKVKAVLAIWAADGQPAAQQELFADILRTTTVFLMPRFRDRLIVQCRDRTDRAELCRALLFSATRKRDAPLSRVTAKLTASQIAEKEYIWRVFSDPDTLDLPPMQRSWREGYKLVLLVEEVIIYAAGHAGFKINFSLSHATVAELVKQASMLVPNDPGSAATLK